MGTYKWIKKSTLSVHTNSDYTRITVQFDANIRDDQYLDPDGQEFLTSVNAYVLRFILKDVPQGTPPPTTKTYSGTINVEPDKPVKEGDKSGAEVKEEGTVMEEELCIRPLNSGPD